MKKENVMYPLLTLGIGMILVLMTVQIAWGQLSPNCAQLPVNLWVNRVARPPQQGSPYVQLDLEDYVTGVLEGEMAPIASIPQWDDGALQAGSVAIRTWSAYWCHKHTFTNTPYGTIQGLYDTSNAPYFDQEYDPGHSGNTARYSQTVTDTQGIYLTYSNVLIDAQYRARNGDPTNPLENPFTRTSYPYLRSVSDPVAASETRSQSDGQSVGLAQNGSHYWASGQDPTAEDRFYPQWRSYAQILTHYYTGLHWYSSQGCQRYSVDSDLSMGTVVCKLADDRQPDPDHVFKPELSGHVLDSEYRPDDVAFFRAGLPELSWLGAEWSPGPRDS